MSAEGLIWVYKYRFWNPTRDEMVVAPREGTLDAIRNGLGIPILESGKRVARRALDPHGFARLSEGDRA